MTAYIDYLLSVVFSKNSRNFSGGNLTGCFSFHTMGYRFFLCLRRKHCAAEEYSSPATEADFIAVDQRKAMTTTRTVQPWI